MNMTGSDFYSGSALSGAASGATTGAMIGSYWPGWGTAIGAVGGGLLGLAGGAYANSQRSRATQQQTQNIDQVIAKMRALSASNYAGYLQGLNKALAFYGPVTQRWNKLYGTGGTGNFPAVPSVGGASMWR